MERLTGEARDRVRASSLTFVGAIVVGALVLLLYGGFVGYEYTVTVPAVVVGVSEDGRELTLELVHDGCQREPRLEVQEEDDAVLVTPRMTERRPYFRDCGRVDRPLREQLVLTDPLGDRPIRYRAS